MTSQTTPDIELSVVIPAYNEVATVDGVVRTHQQMAASLARSFEIVVCDDGSSDGTWNALLAAREAVPELQLFRHETNQDIPATMKRLYAEARGEWIYFAPADGQVPAEALGIMWAARDGAALVVGRRIPRRDPASRVLIGQLYSALLRAVFRFPIRDVDSVKLYRRDELRRTEVRSSSNFFEAEILIALCRRGATLREVVIPHRPRIAGKAKGVTPRSAALAAWDVGTFALRDLARRLRPG